ncbi:helix-turn-helix transcriptional regulator [Streptomyces sp. RKND-216]|uniref:helix-turn-helix transcriptional regulator n=1 Tax=Streptomyces sp. RKND-216 TaxID=2562581 RepID=UPI001FF8456A|nr:helix-turn-helix transcriptional regulator [Streptomyces sp. RKND-216]
MLEALDLDPVQQQAYEALVDGAVTLPELRAALGPSGPRAREVLASLERLRLAERVAGARGESDRWLPVAPDVAFETLLTAREEQLQRARLHVQLLATRYRATTGARDPMDLVEVVIGRAAVIRAVDQLQRSARHEVRGIDRPPYANTGPDRTDPRTGMMPLQEETMRRGVGYRVIYDTAGLRGTETVGPFHSVDTDLAACAELGEDARVMSGTPTKLMLADDRCGVIPLRTTPYEVVSGVVVHPSGLLEALGGLFEVLWERAQPLHGDREGPDPDDARLLALLTTGLTDPVMARQLGVSHRTFQRRLRALMERVGAATRFQLGARATALGWLADTRGASTGDGVGAPCAAEADRAQVDIGE